MAEQPINSDQIIDPKFLDIAIAKANEFLIVNKELTDVLKTNLGITKQSLSNIKINNSADLKQQAFLTAEAAKELKNLEALKKAAAQTEQALQKVEQERIRTNRELAKSEAEYNRQITKNTKDVQVATNAYDALKKKYNDLSRAQMELDARGRNTGVVFRGIQQEALNLRAELDRVEQGAGRFQRNVGNYTSTFNGLGNSVNQLTREMPAFAVSMNTGFLAISNNLPIFFDQLQKINAENAILLKQGKPIESVFSKLGGAIFSMGSLLSVGVTLLTIFGGKIVKVIGSLFDSADAFTLNAEALKEYTDALNNVQNAQDDLDKSIGSLQKQLIAQEGLIGKAGDAQLEALDKLGDQYIDREKKRKIEVGKIITAQLKDGEKEVDIEVKKVNGITEIRRKGSEEVIRLNADANKILTNYSGFFHKEIQTQNEKAIQDKLDILNREDAIYKKKLDDEYAYRLQIDYQDYKADKAKKKAKEKDLIDLTDRIIKQNILNESDTKQRAESMAKFDERIAIKEVNRINATWKQKQLLILAIQQDTINNLIKIDEDYTKKEQDIINKNFEEKNAIADINIKATHKVIEDNRDFELWTLEQQYNEEKAKGDKASKAKLIKLNQLILDKKALLIQARADEEKEGKTDFEKTAIQNKADIDIKKLKLDSQKKDADDNDKFRAEQLKKDMIFASKIIDAIAKAEAEKSKVRVEGFDRAIKDEEKNIETQRNLAQRGLKNTLAEEEARKIQLERQKEEEKQKEIKRQKALAFFKLFASYAEKDPNTALQNALKDTIIAEAVSAAFIDGTENVGKDAQFTGNKFKNGQDGYIAKFDGDERIINPEQNRMIGNLSNEALADLAYKHNNGLLDTAKYGVIQSSDFGSNIANSALLMATIQTNKRLESLEQAINNKPVPNFEFDKYGDFIKEVIEGGFTKRTTIIQNKPRI
jgi:hypothetical protein